MLIDEQKESMIRYFNGKSQRDQNAVCESLIQELNGFLGVGLSFNSFNAGDYTSFLNYLSIQVSHTIEDDHYAYGRDETLQLIAMLATDRQETMLSFINDMAEILFLNRANRTEYVCNKSATEPYRINKLMLEYAMKSRSIDVIISVLTKGFCATNCDRLPNGCCTILGYDMGLVPQTMLRLQAVESRRNGHITPKEEDKCKYHTNSGCTIALFKSPACIGYLCDGLKESMKEKYPAFKLKAFRDCLSGFRNCYIDRKKVFEAMDATIASGNALLAAELKDRLEV